MCPVRMRPVRQGALPWPLLQEAQRSLWLTLGAVRGCCDVWMSIIALCIASSRACMLASCCVTGDVWGPCQMDHE